MFGRPNLWGHYPIFIWPTLRPSSQVRSVMRYRCEEVCESSSKILGAFVQHRTLTSFVILITTRFLELSGFSSSILRRLTIMTCLRSNARPPLWTGQPLRRRTAGRLNTPATYAPQLIRSRSYRRVVIWVLLRAPLHGIKGRDVMWALVPRPMQGQQPPRDRAPIKVDGRIPVSYTHLTLPTKRIV